MRAQIRLCPKLHWQDYVSQKELAVKYLSASLFVFPSLAEGFGLPLLEAMQAGTPVLCSDIPVFHEVGGNVVTYVQPTPEAFCQALLTADHLKTPSPEVLYARSQEFTWEKTAAQTMNVLLQAGSANQ